MIVGEVSPNGEAKVALTLVGLAGRDIEADAVIDTGFTGDITLPPGLVVSLGFTWITRGRALLSNGTIDQFDVFAGTILWDGAPRRVMVEQADTDPLIGMQLMYGYDIEIRNVVGGRVLLRRADDTGP
jgi:clan AA aspartic protease